MGYLFLVFMRNTRQTTIMSGVQNLVQLGKVYYNKSNSSTMDEIYMKL